MFEFLSMMFERLSPVFFFVSPFLFLSIVIRFIRIFLSESSREDIEAYYEREHIKDMKRQRRAARRRLMKYKRECNHKANYDFYSRSDNAYFVEFMREK